jgi:GGDEF domain-containing protein
VTDKLTFGAFGYTNVSTRRVAYIECNSLPKPPTSHIGPEVHGQQLTQLLGRYRLCAAPPAHEIIAYSSRHDLMTRLLNREHFLQALSSAYEAGEDAVFLMVDADHFKRVNDTFGHASGDDALVTIAAALKQAVRRGRGRAHRRRGIRCASEGSFDRRRC